MDGQTDLFTNRQTHWQTGGQAGRQLDGQTCPQTDRHTIRRADRQTNAVPSQNKSALFLAHSGPVKNISVLDCEYSFMSASKDKTVRLWSIRNCGDGTVVSQADALYLDHKRPVTEIRFLARERLAASCDGAVHLWDPWTLATVSRIEVVSQANFIDCSAAPSSVLLVAHLNEETCFVSRFDVRCRMGPAGTGQFRVSPNSPGVIRCLVISPDDSWFACGFSSGKFAYPSVKQIANN